MKLSNVKTTLDYAKNFLATQDFIAILQHFAFDEDTVTAYNDVSACQLKLDTGLSCTIPGNLMIRLLNTLKNEEFDIEKHETHVNVVHGRSKTKLPILPLEEFVFQLPQVTEEAITLPSSSVEGLRKCLTNVSTNPTRPEFNGVNFVIENQLLSLYSSDGATISRFQLNDTFNLPPTDQIQCILPAFFCERLTNLHGPLAGKESAIPIQFSKSWATANLNNNMLFTRVIDKKPPKFSENISKFIPNLDQLELWEIPEEFESVIDRAMLFLNPQANINQSTFNIRGDEVEITTTSTLGNSHDIIQIPNDLGTFSFTVDPTLLMRGFKVCKKMTLTRNVIIMEDGNFLHLIATN